MTKVLLESRELDEREYLELTDDQLRLLRFLEEKYWLVGGDAIISIIDKEPDFKRI